MFGSFSQNKFIFLYLCQNTLFWQIKIFFKTSFDKKTKNSPFSHNQISPPQESSFSIGGFCKKTSTKHNIF
jgi:hypothetical protein